ncbi:MAG: hypothetical protein ACYDD2_02775 [Candidatus Acidiferrales bacterium]
MERLKIFARAIAFLGLLTWCMSSAWAAQGQAKPRKTPPAKPAAGAPSSKPPVLHARDPFAPLIRTGDVGGGHLNLPPGIAGLQVSTLQLEGMAKTADGMVAVVSNPQGGVYFLHDGDHLYDGVVEKIGLNQITFQQENKDAFGRTVQREVTKRLYPIAGDEQ